MTLFQSILLGIIQGITEFLPVSSSGHLVLVPALLGWDIPAGQAFVYDVLVQVATLVGVAAYFWGDLAAIIPAMLRGLWKRQPFTEPAARLGWLIVVATIPAGLGGMAIKDQVEAAFSNPRATALFLLVTAGLLLLGESLGRRRKKIESLTWVDALVIGVFQAIAILPGVSRSGATITGGMTRQLERPAAARFSFLMSLPIMLAAGLLAGLDMLKSPPVLSQLNVMWPGFLIAAVTGYLSIRWLLGFLARRPMTIFVYYCAGLGLLSYAILSLRG